MKVVHTEKIESHRDPYFSEGMERGKSWVRMNLREWPYDCVLETKLRKDPESETGGYLIDFFFKRDDVTDEVPIDPYDHFY